MKSLHKSSVKLRSVEAARLAAQQQNFLFLSSEPRNSIYVPA
jgi:hypothetical protein